MSSTPPRPGSRLAQVANQRRRRLQRKQKSAAVKAAGGDESRGIPRERKESKNNNSQQEVVEMELSCAPTQSLTFDDSTISSGTAWTQSSDQSISTRGSLDFAPPIAVPPPSGERAENGAPRRKTPPRRVSSLPPPTQSFKPSPSRERVKVNSSDDDRSIAAAMEDGKPAAAATTPRRRNKYQRKFPARGAARSPGEAASKTAESEIKVAEMTGDLDSSRLPLGRAERVSNEYEEEHREGAKREEEARKNQIDELQTIIVGKDEQLKMLRSRCEQLNRELDDGRKKAAGRSDQLDQLERKIDDRDKEYSSLRKSYETLNREKDAAEKKDAARADRLEELERKLGEKCEELSASCIRYEELKQEKLNVEQGVRRADGEWKRALEEVKEERDEMQENWKNCLDQLDRVEAECQEKYSRQSQRETDLEKSLRDLQSEKDRVETECQAKYSRQSQRETDLEKSLRDLQHEKRSALAEAGRELSAAQNKLTEALADKGILEKSLQDHTNLRKSLHDLQNEKRSALAEARRELYAAQNQLTNALADKSSLEKSLQGQIDLKKSLHDLQNEKRSALAEARRELSATQSQLADALADKSSLEKSLHDQISDLQNELQMQRNSGDNVKHHHARIVDGLKSDLAKSRRLREESSSSLQRDMETMQMEHDENVKYHQEEVKNLRLQLRSAKERADDDRKELDKEKENLTQQLAQANKDIDCLKSVRDKDIQLLESELDKTHKSKVGMEVEFKDTKRQLSNALRNLEDMALDGGRMQTDLEGVVDDFAKEKAQYQELQRCNVEQNCRITDLLRENERHEMNCKELQQSVQTLEDRCLALEGQLAREMQDAHEFGDPSMKVMELNKQQDEVKADNEVLLLEIKCLKGRLRKAEEEAESAFALAESRGAKTALSSQSEPSYHQAEITQLQCEKQQLETQIAQHIGSIETLRRSHQEASANLSQAEQTMQILMSKERYLESRVESLANQTSETAQDEDRCLASEGQSTKEIRSAQKLEDPRKATESNKRQEEGNEVLLSEIQRLKGRLRKAEEEAESAFASAESRDAKIASPSQPEQSDHITQLQCEKQQLETQLAQHAGSMESLRRNQREASAKLSQAQQTIQILKSKERYLESRVESLANQISTTVQDYEMRLSNIRSGESSNSRGVR